MGGYIGSGEYRYIYCWYLLEGRYSGSGVKFIICGHVVMGVYVVGMCCNGGCRWLFCL